VPDLAFTNTYNLGRNADIKYILNEAPQGQQFRLAKSTMKTFSFNLDANDTPLMYDIDGNNTLDLLVGKSYGNLEYYTNVGTNISPNFQLVNNELGGLPLEPFDRVLTLSITDFNGDGKADLVAGDRNGQLKMYPSIRNQLNKTFEPVKDIILNPGTDTYMAAKLSGYIFPATGDLDGDSKPDLVIGTQAGGLIILKNLTENGGNQLVDPEAEIIYPNPIERYLYFRADATTRVDVFSVLGQLLISYSNILPSNKASIDLKNLPQGTYLVKISNSEVSTVKKIVVIR
jgi:hypothetical protein